MTSDICPYDDEYCERAAKSFERWKQQIAYLAKNHVNQMFWTGPAKCCLEENSCDRYRRYLNIKLKLEQQFKQASENQR